MDDAHDSFSHIADEGAELRLRPFLKAKWTSIASRSHVDFRPVAAGHRACDSAKAGGRALALVSQMSVPIKMRLPAPAAAPAAKPAP